MAGVGRFEGWHPRRPSPAAPETFDGWVHRVGVREARAAVERDVQNATITRDDYANRVAAIDRLQLD